MAADATDVTQCRTAVFVGESTSRAGLLAVRAASVSDAPIVDEISSREIARGALKSFDAVVFPGGSGKAQALELGDDGCSEVVRFVRDGGGYLGICGGAYLASLRPKWSLKILAEPILETDPAKEVAPRENFWFRGDREVVVSVELTPPGCNFFGSSLPQRLGVAYHNGPIFNLNEGASNVVILAEYRSEVSYRKEQIGTMIHTPAMLMTTYGRGRVFAVSPHLEMHDNYASGIRKILQWLCIGTRARRSRADSF